MIFIGGNLDAFGWSKNQRRHCSDLTTVCFESSWGRCAAPPQSGAGSVPSRWCWKPCLSSAVFSFFSDRPSRGNRRLRRGARPPRGVSRAKTDACAVFERGDGTSPLRPWGERRRRISSPHQGGHLKTATRADSLTFSEGSRTRFVKLFVIPL